MTAVLANEITILQSLLRGLCLGKTRISVVNRGKVCLQTCVSQPVTQSVRETSTSSTNIANCALLGRTCGALCCFRITTTHPWLLSSAVSSTQQQRSYAKKPARKPLSFDYSGDLVTQSPLDLTELHKDFQEFSELQKAPDVVHKLCTLDFASGEEKRLHRKQEMRERILKLFGPAALREMTVAMLTVDIRNSIQHVLTDRKDKKSKSILIEKIQLRKKILKYLRREDYQRFMWLLRELRIRYVLPPDYYRHESKKYKKKKEVFEAADALRKKKIEDLRVQLEAEKEEFMKYKATTLQQIEEDMAKYNLNREEFEAKLVRKREGKTYPRIYTWEERQKMAEELAMK